MEEELLGDEDLEVWVRVFPFLSFPLGHMYGGHDEDICYRSERTPVSVCYTAIAWGLGHGASEM